MNETPMLFPVSPAEFWKQLRTVIEEVVDERLSKRPVINDSANHLPEKALLKTSEVCFIFQVSKPTVYEWLKQEKLKSFKVKSRRYFRKEDIEEVIKCQGNKT